MKQSFMYGNTADKQSLFQFSSIDRFEFSYFNGNFMHGRVVYRVEHKSDKYEIFIQSDQFAADECFIRRLLSILKEHRIDQWNGFDHTDETVMDGSDFYLLLSNESGRIDAYGYEAWPENYQTVKLLIDELFMSFYK